MREGVRSDGVFVRGLMALYFSGAEKYQKALGVANVVRQVQWPPPDPRLGLSRGVGESLAGAHSSQLLVDPGGIGLLQGAVQRGGVWGRAVVVFVLGWV